MNQRTPRLQKAPTASDKMRKGHLGLSASVGDCGSEGLKRAVATCSTPAGLSSGTTRAAPGVQFGSVVSARGAIRCLLSARALLVRGWARDGMAVDADGREVFATYRHASAVAWSLPGALACSDVERAVHVEHARRVLRHLLKEYDIPAWNRHPLRTQEEVLVLVDRALVDLGAEPPRERPLRPRKHRGGWSVTRGVGPHTPRVLSGPAPQPSAEERVERLEREVLAAREELGDRAFSFNLQLAAALKRAQAAEQQLQHIKKRLGLAPRVSTGTDDPPPKPGGRASRARGARGGGR